MSPVPGSSPRRRGGRKLLLVLLALGLAIRLWGLPRWGTFDTEVQKAWSARAATAGVAGVYGPPDGEILRQARERGGSIMGTLLSMPFPNATFEWGNATYFVDYPPGSVLVLSLAGKLYRALEPDMRNRPLFNAVINLGPFLASVAILLLLARSARGADAGEPVLQADPVSASRSSFSTAWRRALVFWLNPAMILAAPILGYQDTIFGALALGAVMALQARGYALSWALIVAAGLVKPQGALLLPTLLAVTLREASPGVWLRTALAGVGTAALILFPWWRQGYLLAALDGCRRPLAQGTLSALGLNAWWIGGYVMEWFRSGPWPLAPLASIEEFREWAGWDPRPVSRALLLAATAANLALLLRGPRADRRLIVLSVIVQVHAYALLGTSVHENHTILAVILAPLLLGSLPEAPTLIKTTSAFLFVSLFLGAGFGRRITTQRFLEELRSVTVLDLSVIVAAAHVALVAALFAWMARTRRSGAGEASSAMLRYRPVTSAPAPSGGPAPSGERGRVVIVMPAYNAARTLEDTFRKIPQGYYDEIVVVDDHSRDETAELAQRLELKAIRHPHNVGYGGNQKTCYMEALRDGAQIVVMLHPDGQYDPAIIPEMIRPIREGRADMVLGSRMMVPGAAEKGGMPWWKWLANRFLTRVENAALGTRFSECHTGYRAYSRRFLETVPFLRNSNGFVFDTEVIFQAVHFGLPVVEVPISTRYFADASSVDLRTSVVYGFRTLWTALRFLLHRGGLVGCDKFRR